MSVIVKGGGGAAKQEKTVTAGTYVKEVLPDTGKLLSKVVVNPTPTEEKTVTPTTSQQTISPSEGKHLAKVIVNAMEDVTPEVTAQTPLIEEIAEKFGVSITTPSGTNKQILQGNNTNLQSIKENAKGGFPNGTEWTQVNDGKIYEAICYAKGIWAAGGNDNASGIRYSLDGKTWTQSNITSRKIFHIYYADGLWIACSLAGHYISEGAKTWTFVSLKIGNVLKQNGIWVACGSDNNGLFYSTDGRTWTQSNVTSSTHDFDSLYNANGMWLASGGLGLYYSIDGKTWTGNSNVKYINSFGYYDNVFVACSGYNEGLYYSLDGKTWTQSNITSGFFNHVHNKNGLWVACASGGIYYSFDGKTWTQSNITSGTFVWSHNANGIWVALGQNTTSLGIYYSLDGKTWVQSNITSGYFYQAHNENGIWVAGYSNGICYSPTWEPA